MAPLLILPNPRTVMASYYGGILVNNFIGSSGSAEIVELTIPDDNVSGYAAFEGNVLKRAVFINMHAWLLSSTGTRPFVHIDLLSTFSSKTASAKRLIINHADDTQNLTFAGQSFETSDARPTGKISQETIDLTKGLDIRSTEAVLLSF
ncbi:hypothetical protein QCA50_004413 [Cerrena zonata]|uniref:Beta-glucuronidase C-terminal domain-containing protein n=1 Tax=Cerrena zonata TaxID=2478898 RepID=A0AAW0GNZ0_9APHY